MNWKSSCATIDCKSGKKHMMYDDAVSNCDKVSKSWLEIWKSTKFRFAMIQNLLIGYTVL